MTCKYKRLLVGTMKKIRFRLRTVLILVLLIAAVCLVAKHEYRRVHRQNAVVQDVEQSGGLVVYSSDTRYFQREFLQLVLQKARGILARWFGERLGPVGFAAVGPHNTLETLKSIAELKSINNLGFINVRVKDKHITIVRDELKPDSLAFLKCNFEGTSDESFYFGEHIQSLQFSAGTVVPFDQLQKHRKLIALRLEVVTLSQQDLFAIASIPSLQNLVFLNCSVADDWKALRGATRLTSVTLRGMAIDDSFLEAIATIPSIRELDILGTNLTADTAQILSRLKNLHVLHVDAGIKRLIDAQNLSKSLPSCQIRYHSTQIKGNLKKSGVY